MVHYKNQTAKSVMSATAHLIVRMITWATSRINSFTAIGDKIGFANTIDPDETAHNEPSHLDLCCLTFSLSTLHINYFPSDTLFKKKQQKKKTDDKCCLKFGTERVKESSNMREMHRFRSSFLCAKNHPYLCSPFIHTVVSSDSVSRQWWPWSDCAQADLGLRCPHIP